MKPWTAVKPFASGTPSVGRAALLAATAAGLAFANSVGNDFAYDDRLIVAGNEDIRSLRTLPGTFVKPYWPNAHGRELGLWRPVATWVYGIQWALWDGEPAGFHLVNVLLNSLATALVVLVLGELLPVSAALLAGLVFAVHPVHTEAVANVVGMAELLSATLYLGACLVAVRCRGRMGSGRVLVVTGLFLAAALTKESAVTLPGAILLADAAGRNLHVRHLRAYLMERWPLYAALVVSAGLVFAGRLAVLGSIADPYPPMGAEVLAGGEVPRIWTVLGTWPEVFRLFFLPWELSADYTPPVIPVAFGWTARSVCGLILGLGALVIAGWCWKRGPVSPDGLSPATVSLGVLWLVVTLLPASNLLFLSGVLLAERTLYLPSVGFAAGVGWMLAQLRRERPRTGTVVIAVGLALLCCRTIARNPSWKDNATVFATLLREHPESGRAQWVMGDVYMGRGDRERGLAAYRRAIGMVGGSYTLVAEIGRRMLAEGFDQAGEHLLRRAWRDRPEFGLAPSLLAIHYDRHERWELAEETSRAAIGAEPHNTVQMHLLARSLAALGRTREAAAVRRLVIRAGEDRIEQWKWIAELELRRGDTARAISSLDSARIRTGTAAQLAEIDSIRSALSDGLAPPAAGSAQDTHGEDAIWRDTNGWRSSYNR